MGIAAIAVLLLMCAIRFQLRQKTDVQSMQDDQFDTFNLVPPRKLPLVPPTLTTSNRKFDTFDFRISDSEHGRTIHAVATKNHLHQASPRQDDDSDDSSGSSNGDGVDMGEAMARQYRHQARQYYDDSDDSSGSSNSKNSM